MCMKYFEISKINIFCLKCVNFLGSECLKEIKVIVITCESSWPLRDFTLKGWLACEEEEEEAES